MYKGQNQLLFYIIFEIAFIIIISLISRTSSLNSQEQTCYTNELNNIYKCQVRDLAQFRSSFMHITETDELTIKCVSSLRSNLTSAVFQYLQKLITLKIEKCKIFEIQENAFQDLINLQNLYFEDSSIDLTLEKHLFNHIPNITILNFINTNFNSNSNDLLCPLKNLKRLELSNSDVRQSTMIGCGQNNTCCHHLETLKLNNNDIKTIVKTDFPFPNLNVLIMYDSNVSQIQSESFNNLKQLTDLWLSNNKLDTLDNKLLNKNTNLEIIRLENNKLHYLPSEIFCNLNQLYLLDLSYNWLKLNDSSSNLFSKLISLSYLYLNNNNIDYLPKTIFDNLAFLRKLDLSNNFLSRISDNNFSQLKSLTLLTLQNNSLVDISKNAFNGLLYLRELVLSENKLKNVTDLYLVKQLESLDLSNNLISHIDHYTFIGLSSLNKLNLNNNKITKLTKSTFYYARRLKEININRNEISEIERGTFLFDLNLLDLSYNKIRTMKSLFKNVEFKLILDDNEISRFDFNDIRMSIKIVSLVRNKLKEIHDESRSVYRLEEFYADQNQLNSFDLNVFPDTIKIISLTNNNISQIKMLDHNTKENLIFLNLENNSIAEIDFRNIAISTTGQYFHVSKILINMNKNPLACSCLNDWLLDSEKSIALPSINRSDTCTPIYSRIKKFTNKLNTKTMQQKDLLCKTKQNCPTQCLCFINRKIRLFVIDCFNVTWTNALTNESFLTETKQTQTINDVTFFFDANTNINVVIDSLLAKLTEELFVGRILYMNDSQLTTIDKNMFQSVPNLIELHLEQNHLSSLSNEFHFIPKLEKLFLHQNYLQFLSSNTFNHLVKLKYLSLHNNQLSQPQLWTMLPYSPQLTLSDNPFQCDCDFVTQFQKWTGKTQIKDLNDTLCHDTFIPIMGYDISYCFEQPLIAIIVPTIGAFIFLIVLVVLLYLYRLEMKVWLYSRHGIRLFYHNQPADEGKRYDAFISYANEDDEWIAHQLVPKLEGYVLCLHQRDFPAGGYISDSIIYAVQNSCRTVIILSPNYVNSMWCRFEFDTAHMQSLEDRCKRVVVVILEDVDRSKLDKNLQVYLKTNTYLERDDSLFWEKLKYALPNLRCRQEQGETSF